MPYSAFPPSLPNPLQPLPAAQKVLVVDDVPDNATVICQVIKDLCGPLVAYTGEEALALAHQHQPDLILLDIRMPGMDGFEVCRRLKADLQTAHIPIIFLTALTEPHCEELGLNLGAVDFVTKPFRPAVLKARVRTHLEIAQQRQMLQLLSHSDGLTGVANRRFFSAQLEREFMRLQRLGEPLSLVMMDVDHFKAYNDHYGHLVGDECLSQISQAIQGALHRPGDLLARYGGGGIRLPAAPYGAGWRGAGGAGHRRCAQAAGPAPCRLAPGPGADREPGRGLHCAFVHQQCPATAGRCRSAPLSRKKRWSRPHRLGWVIRSTP